MTTTLSSFGAACGPDGAIWVTDYYREIIEDYSAIPRHLRQQYGVYGGHDRGRIHRLTHRGIALTGPRDAKRGHEVFTQSCAVCHQVGKEGHVFGPDLLGELGVAKETLVRHLLLPNKRIRPGYETTLVELHDGILGRSDFSDEHGAYSYPAKAGHVLVGKLWGAAEKQ